MDPKKYDRTISLACPTCGGTQFSQSDNGSEEIHTCAQCNRILTKAELLRENSENIKINVDEVKTQLAKDVQKELKSTLEKAFKGNKHFRIR